MSTTTAAVVTTKRAAELAGPTNRQVDYWVRNGRIKPEIPPVGSGSRAGYSLRNVLEIRAVYRASPSMKYPDQVFTAVDAALDGDLVQAIEFRWGYVLNMVDLTLAPDETDLAEWVATEQAIWAEEAGR